MQRAGAAAAAEIALRYREQLNEGILILAGPGNNGGDAWVVARALAGMGACVRVIEPMQARTPDAMAERALAFDVIEQTQIISGALPDAFEAGESLVIDGLLGTGTSGAPRGSIAAAITRVNAMRARGSTTVAIDVPSGLDATTGNAPDPTVEADLTLTFGTAKRGHLINRQICGRLVVLDIGLGNHAGGGSDTDLPLLVDEQWVAECVPGIPADAHKGIRKKLAIVGGSKGMAGACVLAARSALRSGVGMVKLVVADESVPVIQEAEPAALAVAWPEDDAAVERDIVHWADCVVIGPGLGRSGQSRAVLERVLRGWTGPIVLDADAITLFENRTSEFAQFIGRRATLLTPHPVEFSRISGKGVDGVLAGRFEIGAAVAKQLGATILLKGTPTVITSPDGRRLVSAAGTAALATAGSGDVLSGIAGTLLAQIGDAFVAGAIAAWVHGRAAERVPVTRPGDARGILLDDIVGELRDSWSFDQRPGRYPVLAELSDIGSAK